MSPDSSLDQKSTLFAPMDSHIFFDQTSLQTVAKHAVDIKTVNQLRANLGKDFRSPYCLLVSHFQEMLDIVMSTVNSAVQEPRPPALAISTTSTSSQPQKRTRERPATIPYKQLSKESKRKCDEVRIRSKLYYKKNKSSQQSQLSQSTTYSPSRSQEAENTQPSVPPSSPAISWYGTPISTANPPSGRGKRPRNILDGIDEYGTQTSSKRDRKDK